MIDEAVWIDDDMTKKAALKKLEVMEQMLGYPDELLDEALVSAIYEDVDVDEDAPFLKNGLGVLRSNVVNSFSK